MRESEGRNRLNSIEGALKVRAEKTEREREG
jgi:hypothetical protein